MPARTTVISSLSRITDEGPKLLPHNELLQMAGRAGRRGFDTEGNCVVLQNKWVQAAGTYGWKGVEIASTFAAPGGAVPYGM